MNPVSRLAQSRNKLFWQGRFLHNTPLPHPSWSQSGIMFERSGKLESPSFRRRLFPAVSKLISRKMDRWGCVTAATGGDRLMFRASCLGIGKVFIYPTGVLFLVPQVRSLLHFVNYTHFLSVDFNSFEGRSLFQSLHNGYKIPHPTAHLPNAFLFDCTWAFRLW